MAKKKSGLGRGLGEIFDEITSAYEHEIPTEHSYEEIPIVEIEVNPYQPRKVFNEAQLKELSASIKEHGLLQPVVVVREMDGYILIAGERRLRACKMAKMTKIKATIVDASLSKMHELALIENIQRENLNPIELAESYAALIQEHDLTHEELSDTLKKSRTQISNTLRLLSLGEMAKQALLEEKITQGHAKVLVGLDKKEQELMVNSIVGQKLSVREVEQMVKNLKVPAEKEAKKVEKSPEAVELDLHTLQEIFAQNDINVRFSHNSCHIQFHSQQDVDEFAKLLGF